MDRELSSPPIGESCAGIKNGQNGVDVTRNKRRKPTAAFGASCPLPSVPTNVRLLNRLPTLDLGDGNYSSCPYSCPCQDDEATTGAAWGVFVRSPHAFAGIRGIDTASAQAAVL